MRRVTGLPATRPTAAVALLFLGAALVFFAGALWPPPGQVLAGHAPVYAVFVWTPLLLAALVWAIERRRWAAAVVAGGPWGLAVLAGHVPSFLYVGMIWAAFVAYLLLTRAGAG